MADNKISVFLIVQSRLLREGLERLLSKERDITLVATSCVGCLTKRQSIDTSPDVFVVEAGMLAAKDASNRPVFRGLQNSKLLVIGTVTDDGGNTCSSSSYMSTYVTWEGSVADVVEAVRRLSVDAIR